jgi:electron transfer flavoprotein alpha/beta subunit
MRIAVGFKVTPDFEALRAADWARLAAAEGPEGRAEAARYVRRVFGVFDEAALELALRLRDARADRGLPTGLAAFTVGGPEATPFLATLQALGFACARVDPAAGPSPTAGGAPGLDFAPAATALLVAACAQRLGSDVLLLGERGGPGGSGTVPFLAAEELGRPCVAGVTTVEPAADDRLRVTFADDDGPVRAVATTPCVLAVGNAVVSMLRVPTLRERLAVRDTPIAEYTAQDLGVDLQSALDRGAATLASVEPVDHGRAGVVVPGETPAEQAHALYEGHLRARLEQL